MSGEMEEWLVERLDDVHRLDSSAILVMKGWAVEVKSDVTVKTYLTPNAFSRFFFPNKPFLKCLKFFLLRGKISLTAGRLHRKEPLVNIKQTGACQAVTGS